MIDYQPPAIEPEVLFSDADILVVNKPAGLLSVPGRLPEHQDCLIGRVQHRFPEALIVHRLDRATSGLLVLARNADAHSNLSRQFEQRRVIKSYLAVVGGLLEPSEGRIELPLSRDWPNRPRQKVDLENGKPATTDYRVVHHNPAENTTLVELHPLTGRTHQLRVHLQALGHPILGDDLYADPATLLMADRLLLHAQSLSFSQPSTGRELFFQAEAPF